MYHKPVMLEEALEWLDPKPAGCFVDVTFGGGGHSRAILDRMKGSGKLLGFDQDPDAGKNAVGLDPDVFTLVKSNFCFLRKYMEYHGLQKVDGLLADLGVSSHQFDEGSRGFSWKGEKNELDMRMSQAGERSARTILNSYDEKDLADIFYRYGELREGRKIARKIVESRSVNEIKTVSQLQEILETIAPRKGASKFFSKIYQAIRIEVNEELDALKALLTQSVSVLKKGGRLVFISYHSLEDRLVKHFFRSGNFEGVLEKDLYGNILKPLKELTRKPLVPSDGEIEQNPRARSAKMRIAELN
jgi:16S rRNA (cytosine1402-N4)-methyltransferase